MRTSKGLATCLSSQPRMLEDVLRRSRTLQERRAAVRLEKVAGYLTLVGFRHSSGPEVFSGIENKARTA